MIRNILVLLVVAAVTIGLISWISRGGFSSLSYSPSTGALFGTSSSTPFTLPGQPTTTPLGAPLQGDFSSSTEETSVDEGTSTLDDSVRFADDIQGMQTDDPHSEYISVVAGEDMSTEANLTGWTIQSTSGVRIPLGSIVLQSGMQLDLYSGAGWPSFDGHVIRAFLGSSVELWNNTRETVYLLNPSGTVVDTISY